MTSGVCAASGSSSLHVFLIIANDSSETRLYTTHPFVSQIWATGEHGCQSVQTMTTLIVGIGLAIAFDFGFATFPRI